jgi:hypothetical protein
VNGKARASEMGTTDRDHRSIRRNTLLFQKSPLLSVESESGWRAKAAYVLEYFAAKGLVEAAGVEP